jgi:hypothetical protein
MGGVGAGDVYIDACGETIPVIVIAENAKGYS